MTEERRQRAIREKLARSALPDPALMPSGLPFGPLPRAAMVEIFGPAGSGKTSVALALVANFQKGGGAAAWIDAEHSFDPAYAASLGVVLESLPVVQPDSAEQAFAIVQQLLLSGAIDLVVVDSAAALAPELELQTGMGQSGPGVQSRTLTSGLGKLSKTIKRTCATVVFLNQTRSRPGQQELSAGGPALKLHAALRIALEPRGAPRGARFRVLKTRVGEAFREGEVLWNSG